MPIIFHPRIHQFGDFLRYRDMRVIIRVILSVILVAFGMASSLEAMGETVSQKEASKMAELFFNAVNGQVMAKPKLVYNGKKLTTDRLFSPYYIYNLPKGGFVIISAENKAMPILGYSVKENFDPENMSGGIQPLLQDYARDIEYIRYDPRMPVEAIAAWNYYQDYLGDVISGRYDFSDFGHKIEGHSDWHMREHATEFSDLALTDELEDDTEEEERPFALYEDFVAETRAAESRRLAMLEERVNPTEPVVRSIGGGHFEIVLPEEVVMARVYNLQGAQVETRTFNGTQTAEISLDAEPRGFYFVIINGESGKPYGFKLWK